MIQTLRRSLFWSWCSGSCCFSLIALPISWYFAQRSITPDTDLQRNLFFFGVLPTLTLCFVGQILVQRRLYRTSGSSTSLIVSIPLIYMLAWGCIILAGMNPEVRGLPMLDERTPTPFTWWVAFGGGWLLLTIIGGMMYLFFSSLMQESRQGTEASSD